MAQDDEVPLVRVEVEAPATTTSSFPIPNERQATPALAKLSLAGALLVVLALVFFARPSADQAADGTALIGSTKDAAITTKPPPPVIAPPTIPFDPSQVPVSTVIDLSGRVSELVRADDGFLGLDQFGEGTGPPILRSDDGVEWEAIETVVEKSTDFDTEDELMVSWFGLRTSDTGFSITAAIRVVGDNSTVSSSIRRRLTSEDGVRWEPADEAALVPDSFFLVRIGTTDGSTIYDEQLGDLVATDVVNEHTTIDLGEGAVCWVTDYGNSVRISPCRGREIPITEADISSDFPTAQVLDCLRFLSSPPVITSRAVLVNDETGKAEPFPGSEAPFGSYADQQQVQSGLIIAIDSGVDFLRIPISGASLAAGEPSLCQGIAELNLERQPSLVILDPDTLGVDRVPLPEELNATGFGPRPYVIGELLPEREGEARILVAINNGVWAFDVETRTWDELLDSAFVADSDSAPYRLSESGTRLYRLTSELAIVDLTVEPDGTVSVAYVSTPVRSEPPTSVSADRGSIWFATDEVVFVSDFAGTNLLRRIDVRVGRDS